jgi:hypothetical protein
MPRFFSVYRIDRPAYKACELTRLFVKRTRRCTWS